MEPSVNVVNAQSIAREEIFGPVVSVVPPKHENEAVATDSK
jgi:acyl-CoA reductase-like NAD-dependent aldehyde dehydrogenase